MHADDVREVLLSKEHVSEETPFGPEVLVYKVGGKMFALLTIEEVPVRMNLKCDPVRALELREQYEQIQPGFHMNKKHWNTITCDDILDPQRVHELIDHSYDLVVSKMSKKERMNYQTIAVDAKGKNVDK